MALLLQQLNDYLLQADATPGAPAPAVWGNIAMLDRAEIATALDNHLVLTLVNVEEERTLKNGKAVTRVGSDQVGYGNRPYFLNLFLLFTANYSNYGTALGRLTQVIRFFQGKQKFTFANSPTPGTPPPLVDFQLVIDLLSLSFEEVNHLWGFLGAKQSPSAVFRGRLVVITDQRLLQTGSRIEDFALTGRSMIE